MPDGRLILKWGTLGDPGMARRFRDRFEDLGIAPERLELRGWARHDEMLGEYGDIDIALDPFPFCGGLTTLEALWMGVPVVTWPQSRPVSRQSLGFLTQLGLTDLVATDEDAYVRIAADLAHDRARLGRLRRAQRDRMAAAPICDGPGFTAGLEQTFRDLWRRWCAGQTGT